MLKLRTTRPARKAFALLLVVLTIAALAILATPFIVSMRLQEQSSRNAVAQARARYAVTAAFNHTLAQLMAATNEYGEFAVSFDGLPEEFEWRGHQRSLLLAAEVQDEQGKINVNSASEGCLAVLFADPEFGLTVDEASDRAERVVERRDENGPLPTLHSLVTGGVLTENQLVALRPHITVHSATDGDRGFARVNINTASTPVLRAVLAGVRSWSLQPTPDPANTGNGAMSLVDLISAILSDDPEPTGVWEVRCTDVQTDADTGKKTFTFAVESYPKNEPGTRTDRGTFTFDEAYGSPGVGKRLYDNNSVMFSLCNGTTDFVGGDKFTFSTERFSYVGVTFDPTEVNVLLKWFRASVVSADVDNSTITLNDASKFPATGQVRIRGDVIQYASRSDNVLEGCTDIAITPAAGNTVALIVPDMAAFDARLGEAVTAGDLDAHGRIAIIANAKNPAGRAVCDLTTGLCFMPSGRYSVEAQGVVSDKSGNTTQKMHIRRIISLERGESNVWTIRSQEEFDRAVLSRMVWLDMLHFSSWLGESSGLLTLPGASYLDDVAPSDAADSGVTLAPRDETGDGWIFNGPTLFGATNWYSDRNDLYGSAIPGTALVPGEDIYRDGDPGLFITGAKAFRCFAGPADLDISGGTRSLTVWVKPSALFSYHDDHVFFETGPDDSSEHRNRIRLFWSEDGELVFRISDEAIEPRSAEVRATVAQAAFERGTWHRIEAVWNGMNIGDMSLLLDGQVVGSYSPSGADAEATAAPALVDEKWIARVGNYLMQQGEADPVRQTQAGSAEPKSVYGYGVCRFINQDASTQKGDFNKVRRGGATLAEAMDEGGVTALHAALAADATAIRVDDAASFPEEGYVKIGGEIIKYTDVTIVDEVDEEGNITDTYHELTVPDDGRGRDLGDNVATRAQSDAAAHAIDTEVLCISIEVSDASKYPMPHFLDVPPDVVSYFGLSGLDPSTCLVHIDDEWIGYTHRAEDKFLVNVRATVRDLPGGAKTTTMRGAGGTDVDTHNDGETVLPVYSVTAGGRPGAGDRVTVLHDGLDPDDHKELVIKHATTSGGTFVAFVAFTGVIPGTHDLYIKKGSATLGAGFIKFPSGRYVPQRLASIGAPVSGLGKRADATIGSVRTNIWTNSTTRRIKDALDNSAADGSDVLFGSLGSLYDGGTQWPWGGFGVGTWPLEGFIKIGDEAFFYKVRYPHNIGIDAKLGAVSRSASTSVVGADIPAAGNFVWARQAAESDPIQLGFNPHGGYLIITSYSRTKADDSVNSLESCTQEMLQWLIAEGHVTQAFVDQHGTFDEGTGLWSFDDITVEGEWTTTESREYVRYTSITPATPGAAQYTFNCDAAGRHMYDTHNDIGGSPMGHAAADDGEGGTLYPTLTARTVAMTILRRGAAGGARALGTTRSAHPAGSTLLPLPNVPATIISGPPVSEDFAVALPYEADKLPVEDASKFPESGYIEVVNAGGRREIIYYTGKEEAVITGSDPERKQPYLTGIRHFRGRFGTTPVNLTGLAAFDDVRNTSAAQITAYDDARRIVTLVQPRLHDRMPLLIAQDGAGETSRTFAPHDPDADVVCFEATKTVRGAKWLSVDWTETVPANTDVIVLARVGSSPSWLSAEPVMWDAEPTGGRVIYKFDTPKAQATDNAINAAGDTITIRVFFKFSPGYDTTKWEAPVLKSLTVTYEAGTRVIESEVLDY